MNGRHWRSSPSPIVQHDSYYSQPSATAILQYNFLPDLFTLIHSIFYTFLLPPRPLVAKLSGLQLQRFGILFHKTPGYYHPLALSNTVSKLTSFPFPASQIPYHARPAPLTRAYLEFVCFKNLVIMIITMIIPMTPQDVSEWICKLQSPLAPCIQYNWPTWLFIVS